VVAVDPNTGRILTIVNQKIAFGDGYIPCSTIKPTVALAALEENVITRDTMLKVGRRKYMNLTEAMAHSNNVFFEELGRRMGFDTVSRYARLLGLGELAGYNLPEEHPGSFPMQPPAHGGIARMSSYGEGIHMTPLQLVSLTAAFANGGTLYYLQYPRTADEIQNFAPRVKRDLNIAEVLPEIREGMLAAVLYGTGKRSFDGGGDEMPLGKTGTCNDPTSRVGWFVTYADEAHPKIALAVLLRGRSPSRIRPPARLAPPRQPPSSHRPHCRPRRRPHLSPPPRTKLFRQPTPGSSPGPPPRSKTAVHRPLDARCHLGAIRRSEGSSLKWHGL